MMSLSICSKHSSILFPFFTITLPAIPSGLSNQGAISIPPYFSTFNFTKFFSAVISALAFILNVGESLWAAVMLKPLNSSSGTLKAIIAELFLVTK